MEDAQIVFLLENRKESALYELNNKYSPKSILFRIWGIKI